MAEGALDLSGTDANAHEELTEGVQISNLPAADAHAFYINAELPAERDAIAAEIKRICGTLKDHIVSFTAARNAPELDSSLIDSILCMLIHLRREPSAIVRTAYTNAYHSTSVSRTGLHASDFTYGDVATAPFVLIPIRKHYPQHTLIDGFPHYMLGVFFKATGTLFHFDSMGSIASKEDKDHYRHAVNTLLPHGHIKCRRVVKRPTSYYNQQSSPAETQRLLYSSHCGADTAARL
jgi:hypothetical protein